MNYINNIFRRSNLLLIFFIFFLILQGFDHSFGWGYARIKIFTHAIKGLAESDFILAAKIDKISNV